MSQPNTPDSDALIKQIGIALIRSAPQEWQTVKTEFRAAGRYYELSAEVTSTDGSTAAWTASQDIALMFARLRSTMHSTAGGTWFNARYRVERPAKYNVEFDREEPKWRTPPPIQALRDELRYFPRAEEDVPDWLMMRMSGIPDRTGERRFRIARIFDAQGPGGRPTVNRPPVPEPDRERLRQYLDGARLVLPVRGNDIDRLSADGRHSVPVAFHSDGTWIWPAAVNYYFTKYGLPPEPGLVDHARTQNFTPPELDEQTSQAAAANITGPRPPAAPSPQGPPIRQGATPPASVAELLRQRLDHFGVPAEVYRIGEPAARTWHLSQIADTWQVGWSTGSDASANTFAEEHDAAAFLLGKLLLGPPPVPKTPPAPAAEPAEAEPERELGQEQTVEPARDIGPVEADSAAEAIPADPEPAAQHAESGGHGAGIAGAALAGGALAGGAVAAGAMSGDHEPRHQEAAGSEQQDSAPHHPEFEQPGQEYDAAEPAQVPEPVRQDYVAQEPERQEYTEPARHEFEDQASTHQEYQAPESVRPGFDAPEPAQQEYAAPGFAAPEPAQQEYAAQQPARHEFGEQNAEPGHQEYDAQEPEPGFDVPEPVPQSAHRDYAAESARHEFGEPTSFGDAEPGSAEDIEASGRHEAQQAELSQPEPAQHEFASSVPEHQAHAYEAPQQEASLFEPRQHEFETQFEAPRQPEATGYEPPQHEALQYEPEPQPQQQPAERIDLRTVSPSEGWKQLRLADDPPGELFRNKQVHVLTPGTELDRYGADDGSLTYAGGTPFEQCSLPPDWRDRELHTYRVMHSTEALTGNAVPWFEQPGGGTCFLLPAALTDLIADGTLQQLA